MRPDVYCIPTQFPTRDTPRDMCTGLGIHIFRGRGYTYPCLVPVRRFPSPSRSIRFGDVSKPNGRETFSHGPRDPKRFGREEKWGLGTRQHISLKIHLNIKKGANNPDSLLFLLNEMNSDGCPICYRRIENDGLVEPCRHVFCLGCIQTWTELHVSRSK